MSFSLEVMPKLLCFSSTYLSNWKDTCQEFYTRKHTYEIMQGYDWEPRIIIFIAQLRPLRLCTKAKYLHRFNNIRA